MQALNHTQPLLPMRARGRRSGGSATTSHGSQAIGRLGTPASHGCARRAPTNASTLFSLVLANGLEPLGALVKTWPAIILVRDPG
jgi:hypothetical protein